MLSGLSVLLCRLFCKRSRPGHRNQNDSRLERALVLSRSENHSRLEGALVLLRSVQFEVLKVPLSCVVVHWVMTVCESIHRNVDVLGK